MEGQVSKTVRESERRAREALVVDIEALENGVYDVGVGEETEKAGKAVEHGEGKYFLPNNQNEQARLDLQHQIFNLSFENKLALAPINQVGFKIQDVLDIGTGTGIWAVDFAKQYPDAKVVGFDLSPVAQVDPPQNVSFEIHDAETPFPYAPGSQSYIHGRALMSCFTSPLSVISSAFTALKPGGYLELQDCVAPWTSVDDSFAKTALQKFHQMTIDAAKSVGRDVCQVVRYKSFFEQAGFVDVVEVFYHWPLGAWARDPKMKIIGEKFKTDMKSVIPAVAERLLVKGMGMSRETVEGILDGVRKDMRDTKRVHAYMPGIVVYGKKPE